MLILLNSKSNPQAEMTSICFHSDRKHVPFSPSIWFQNSEHQMWFTESMFSLFAVKNPFQSHHYTDHTNLIVFSTFTFYIIIQPVKLYWMAYDSEHIIILPFFCSILSPNLTFKILNLFVSLFSVLSKMAEILQKKIQVNLCSHIVYYTLAQKGPVTITNHYYLLLFTVVPNCYLQQNLCLHFNSFYLSFCVLVLIHF